MIKLIAVILRAIQTLYQVKILQNLVRQKSQMVSSVGSHYLGQCPNPYQIKFALRDSRRLSHDFLKECYSLSHQADYQIKTGVYERLPVWRGSVEIAKSNWANSLKNRMIALSCYIEKRKKKEIITDGIILPDLHTLTTRKAIHRCWNNALAPQLNTTKLTMPMQVSWKTP